MKLPIPNRVRAAAALLYLLLPGARAGNTYAAEILSGLTALKGGDPTAAAIAFNHAIRLDANEPTAWTAFGAVLLDTGNLTPARECFNRSHALDPASPQPIVGLALCDLASGRSTAARSRLVNANPHDSVSTRRLSGYLDDLANGASPPSLMNVPSIPHWPLNASFDVAKPLSLRWQPNPRIPMAPRPPLTTLAGQVVLHAPVSTNITHATFDMDGAPGGMTNVEPFIWTWDTALWPNGRHNVRITSIRSEGRNATRDYWVNTSNGADAPSRSVPELALATAMLDDALSVRPDPRYRSLSAAKAALAAGNMDAARVGLEDVVADDPRYRDAAHLLRALPQSDIPDQVWRGARGAKRIALTFDDGPNLEHTASLLDTLEALKAPATFFVVGKQAAVHPELVKRMAADGHEVENHTWNHRNLRRLSELESLRELAATKRFIATLTGRPTRFFRPPGGNIGPSAVKASRTLGMSAAMWTFASGKSEGMPVEDMVPRFVHAAVPGAIYLIHNGTHKMETLVSLVVKALRARGWEFVRLDELMVTK